MPRPTLAGLLARAARPPRPRRVLFCGADAPAPSPYAVAAPLDRRRANAYAVRRAYGNRSGRAYARADPNAVA